MALAECCFNPEKLLGAKIDLGANDTPANTALFNESQSRILISLVPENAETTMSFLQEHGIPFQQLGKVGDKVQRHSPGCGRGNRKNSKLVKVLRNSILNRSTI